MMNLLEPGDSAVVGVVGYFGQRLAEMARRSGADVRTVEVARARSSIPRRSPRRSSSVRRSSSRSCTSETTTGACQPIAPMADVARRYGALVAVDCVTSLGGVPLDIDALGVDAAGSCSQKCIGAPPGLAPITIGPRAMDAVRARKHKPSTWYLDLSLLFQYWGEASASRTRAFHHTAPIAAIYGFHEALRLILEEGLEARWARHQLAHEALVRGLDRWACRSFRRRPIGARRSTSSTRRRASTKRRCVAGCSTWAWRWAAGLARSPARCGASASWATTRRCRVSSASSARWRKPCGSCHPPREARGSTVVVAWIVVHASPTAGGV